MKVTKQLTDEWVARKQAEVMALEAQLKSVAEISRLSEQLEISQRDAEMLQKTQIESEKKVKAEQERLQAESSEISENGPKFSKAYENQLREMVFLDLTHLK